MLALDARLKKANILFYLIGRNAADNFQRFPEVDRQVVCCSGDLGLE
jgi:hypothetical protein